MVDEIRILLAHHLPGYVVESMAVLGAGLDHVVYEVNGELIVRRSKQTDSALRSEATRREAELLAVVRELSTVPVPELAFADPDAGIVAYVKLPGAPLLDHPVPEPARLAAPLGRFVSRLHRAPADEMDKLVPRDAEPLTTWRRDAERDYETVAERVPAAYRRLIEDFLGSPPPEEPRTAAFCHNDLGSEHILVDVDTSTVTGIIDWADAAIADPAHDLAMIYRDLGPEVFGLALASYEGRWDDTYRERAVFYARCSLLEDLVYGTGTGPPRYAEAALEHLVWTFG